MPCLIDTGEETMFCKNCGKEIADNAKFCPSCGKSQKVEEIKKAPAVVHTAYSSKINDDTSPKSRTIAALLALFLGGFGIHRFYVGKIGTGILTLLFCWCLIGEIWGWIDFIIIICGYFRDKDGKIISEWEIS